MISIGKYTVRDRSFNEKLHACLAKNKKHKQNSFSGKLYSNLHACKKNSASPLSLFYKSHCSPCSVLSNARLYMGIRQAVCSLFVSLNTRILIIYECAARSDVYL